MKLLPTTRTGKWAAALSMGALLTMLLLYLLAEVLRLLQNDALIGVLAIAAIAAFIIGGVIGLIALLKHRERSSLVFLSVVFGAFVIFFLLVSRFGPQP